MRLIIAALLLMFPLVAWPVGYQECSVLGVPTKHPAGGMNVVGWNTYTGTGIPDGSFQTIDITTNPNLIGIQGIKAVQLMGILIITNADAAASADLHFTAISPTASGFTCADYSAQAVLAGYGGIREPVSMWVPVVDNKFQACWTRTTSGGQGGAQTWYGASIGVNAYCR